MEDQRQVARAGENRLGRHCGHGRSCRRHLPFGAARQRSGRLQASALATIPSREPAELSELLVRGNGLLNDAQAMLKEVGGKLGGTLDSVTSTVSNVNDIAVGLKQGRGAAGMLLRDDELANQIRQHRHHTRRRTSTKS